MKDITKFGLEDIIDMAKKAGYKPKDVPLNDVMGLLEQSQLEVMLIRFAHVVAKELAE